MSRSTLELVARAICEADFHEWPEDSYNGRAQRRAYTNMAQAALDAMASSAAPGEWSREATLVLK
jgi:hypothetical protein